MPSQEDIRNQQDLLATYRRTLAHYLKQYAAQGGSAYVLPNVAQGIEEARNHIQRIKGVLREWGILTDDHPNDSPSKPQAMTLFQSLGIEREINDINHSGSDRHLRIFLCHSSGDKPTVRKLYRWLRADGYAPWLDEEDLLPGYDWQQEILKAVRNSDVVVVCLSLNAINKAGYIQKEIRYALDIGDQQPEDAIFIIPLKFEECNVPDRLSRWQWVNFSEGGYARLTKALSIRASKLGITPPKISKILSVLSSADSL